VRVLFLAGLLALVCFDTAGQLGFKFMAEAAGPAVADVTWVRTVVTSPAFMVTVAAYIGAFFVYMLLVRRVAIGPLFAASHLELVTITAIAMSYFDERFSLVQALGCAVILAGIVVLGFTESAEG
jgi:multidrug transporter EmrE-like cation transporter